MADKPICLIRDCSNPQSARKLCKRHYDAIVAPAPREGARGKLGMRFLTRAHTSKIEGCILWPFAKSRGYGMTYFRGKAMKAHRVACILQNGDPLPGMMACHRCGMKACVNPRHLYWGTRQDNADDAVSHGHSPKGERHGSAKLTTEQATEIKYFSKGVLDSELAKKFGVGETAIGNIRAGRRWRHI